MKQYKPSPVFGFLMILSITAGPLYAVLRGNAATKIEKIISIASIFPLGLIALQIRYREQVRVLLSEPDSEYREKELESVKREHHQILLYGIAIAVLATAVLTWIIFVLMPMRS